MTDKNTLRVGQSRIGLMIDGFEATPRVAVKLARTKSAIEVTIPFLAGPQDPYLYWFATGISFGDDPERAKRRYQPPTTVGFHDADGSVGLVGSRIASSSFTYGGSRIGEGRLTFDYAVLGATSGAAFESINGLRTEIEGLGTWIGLQSLNAEQEFENGRLKAVNLRLASSPSIEIGGQPGASFQANWRYGPGPGPDQTTITERMQVSTQCPDPTTWDDHLDVHRMVRDLLRIASWQPLQFNSHEAMTNADQLRTLDGRTHGPQWLPVVTYKTGIREDTVPKLRADEFLFRYADVGAEGVRTWAEIYTKFGGALAPVAGLLDLDGATLEAHVAQVGIAFEMLGYHILRDRGLSKNKAMDVSYKEYISVVLDPVKDLLPFDVTTFPEGFYTAFKAAKHAGRQSMAAEESYLAYLQGTQILRAWAAHSVGVDTSILVARLESDRRSRHIQDVARSITTAEEVSAHD